VPAVSVGYDFPGRAGDARVPRFAELAAQHFCDGRAQSKLTGGRYLRELAEPQVGLDPGV
jgi:hypothetical protein